MEPSSNFNMFNFNQNAMNPFQMPPNEQTEEQINMMPEFYSNSPNYLQGDYSETKANKGEFLINKAIEKQMYDEYGRPLELDETGRGSYKNEGFNQNIQNIQNDAKQIDLETMKEFNVTNGQCYDNIENVSESKIESMNVDEEREAQDYPMDTQAEYYNVVSSLMFPSESPNYPNNAFNTGF